MNVTKLKLGNEKLFLRHLEYDDANDIAENANDYEIWKNVTDRFPHPYKLENAIEFINFVRSVERNFHFAIIYEGKVIGIISLKRGKHIYRIKAEIGYWIGRKYWNKGIATKAVGLLTHYGFEKQKLEKIEALVFDFNLGSEKVLKKNGFRHVHTFKNHAIKENKIINIKYFALLKEEFFLKSM